MKSKSPVFSSVKILTLAAMLAAMGVVIGIFCKNFMNLSLGVRITFENLPIILAGLLFGPVVGGLVGSVSDLAAAIVTNQEINPLISVGALIVGVVAGIIPRLIRQRGVLQIIVTTSMAHLIGSMIFKTIVLLLWYGPEVLLRIPIEIAVIVIEILILCFLFRRKSFCRMIDRF